MGAAVRAGNTLSRSFLHVYMGFMWDGRGDLGPEGDPMERDKI